MQKIFELIHPRLTRLGNELAPELSRKLQLELFPHVPKHMGRSVNPCDETWAAFGPSPRGYKRYAYLALFISGVGIHARAVVKSDAERRPEMGAMLKLKAHDLEKSFRGTKIQHYKNWDFRKLPTPTVAGVEFFSALGERLAKKDGGIDVGFGWTARDAPHLDRAELLDAFHELAPLYRILNFVN